MRKGELWERKIEGWNRDYSERKLAHIFRCHPGVRQSGEKWWYDSEGPPDFIGIVKEGKFVAFDAKVTSLPHARFPLKNVPAHQAFALGRVTRLGGTAFLLVECPVGRFLVPWVRIWSLWVDRVPTVTLLDVGVPLNDEGWLEAFGSLG